MLDLNSDDDRLRSIHPLNGLGRLADDQTYAVVMDGSGDGGMATTTSYDQYVQPASVQLASEQPVVTNSAVALSDQGGASLPANAVHAVQTLDLPKFDFNTGVATCNTCASDGAVTNALATSLAPAKVTPLPEAPTTTPWLLWAVGLGVAFYALKGGPAGLGNLDEAPAQAPAAPALSGTPPPRRKEPKQLKHVSSLKIS